MKEFWLLVEFEYKKLLKRKIIWIMGGIMGVFSVFLACGSLFGNTYVEGKLFETHYEKIKKQQDYARALSGRRIDDDLVAQMKESFAKVGDTPEDLFYGSELYQTYGRPYEDVYFLLREISGLEDVENLTSCELYSLWEENMKAEWRERRLTEGEIKALENMGEKVERPFIYQYGGSYERICAMIQAIGMALTLFLAACIPGIFADEHTYKMNQMILSCRFGKKTLYCAKCFTGITFSLLAGCFLLGLFLVPVFIFYGADGFSAQIQLFLPNVPWSLCVGEMALIAVLICLLLSAFQCIVCMLLAEKFKSSGAVMALVIGVMLFCMICNVSEESRVFSQIYSYLPINALHVKNLFDCRMVPVFGTYLTAWQAIPAIYMAISAFLLAAGKRQYTHHQVGGK